jgi:hypothetical protein
MSRLDNCFLFGMQPAHPSSMSRFCPNCNSPTNPRSRFCPTCGAVLPISEVTTGQAVQTTTSASTPTETIATPSAAKQPGYVESMSRPAGDSVVTRSPDRAPTVSDVDAPQAFTTPSFEPRSTAETEEKPSLDPSQCPLELAVNFSRALVAGHATTIELRLRSHDTQPLEHIQVVVESRGFGSQVVCNLRRLAPAHSTSKLLEVDPVRSGNFVLQFGVTWESAGQRLAYRGQSQLRILQAPESGNISISIGDIQGNSGSGANQGLGGDRGDVRIENLLGGIKTLNDLLEVEFPEKLRIIPLELDYELSRSAIDVLRRHAGESLRIPPALLTTINPGTICVLEAADGIEQALPFRFVARPQFRLGRARTEADFVAWVLPRNTANDERTMRVGKVHVIADVTNGALTLRDNATANGSLLDGQQLDGAGIKLEHRGKLTLGGTIEVEVAKFDPGRSGQPPVANERAWLGPQQPTQTLRGAVRCEVLSPDAQPLNSVWLLTDAAFGTNRVNAVVLDWPELAEIQGRFHHYRGCFWIENTAETGLVCIDQLTLTHGSIAPLATGQVLRLGSRRFRVNVLP